MKKDTIEKLVKTVGDVRSAAGSALKTSKQVLNQSTKVAQKILNKETVSNGLAATSKGVETVATAAKFASKGAEKVASSLEKASDQLKKIREKLTRKS